MDYANDPATISDRVADAQKIFTEIDNAAAQVGLYYIDTKKSNCMSFNQCIVDNRDGETVKSVEDYNYLGAWISSSKKDVNTRCARAWDIVHKLKPV